MLSPRYWIAVVLAVGAFALVMAITMEIFCKTGVFSSCTGSTFQPFVLLIFGGGAVLVHIFATALLVPIQRFSWFNAWQVVPLYIVAAVVAPKLYMVLTGSDFELSTPFDLTDIAFAIGGFFMGVILLVVWHGRSNPSMQPTGQKPPAAD